MFECSAVSLLGVRISAVSLLGVRIPAVSLLGVRISAVSLLGVRISAVSLLGVLVFGSFTPGFHSWVFEFRQFPSWVFECSSVSLNLSTRKTDTKTYHLDCNHPSRLDCVHAVSNNNLANGCSPRAKLTEEGTTETLRSETADHSGAKPFESRWMVAI